MDERAYVTCGTCGEEYDVPAHHGAALVKEGYFICPECQAEERLAAFDFTNDRGVFEWEREDLHPLAT